MNISICYSYSENWKEVVNYTSKVLELEQNDKNALYYRILGNQNLIDVNLLTNSSLKRQILYLSPMLTLPFKKCRCQNWYLNFVTIIELFISDVLFDVGFELGSRLATDLLPKNMAKRKFQ